MKLGESSGARVQGQRGKHALAPPHAEIMTVPGAKRSTHEPVLVYCARATGAHRCLACHLSVVEVISESALRLTMRAGRTMQRTQLCTFKYLHRQSDG